jgi:tRNA(fMet)-specific endonuclease VapC
MRHLVLRCHRSANSGIWSSTASAFERIARLDEVLADLVRWEYDSRAAREFGIIKSELRRIGRPIPDVDAQIAAIARLDALTLLTSDRHFSWVSGLAIEDWLTA